MHIQPNEARGLKTGYSNRTLPVPAEAIRLGLIDYRAAIEALGYEDLFPDLYNADRSNDPGDRLYDVLAAAFRHAEKDNAAHGQPWGRLLHALRHTFSDTLKQASVPSEHRSDIVGQRGRSENETRYSNALSIRNMRAAMERMPTITEELRPRAIGLLPWVERRQPAPWSRTKNR